MTLQELQNLVTLIDDLVLRLHGTTSDLRAFTSKIRTKVFDTDFAASFDFSTPQKVDEFIAIQAPIYSDKLARVEVAADALGTDTATLLK